MARNLELDLDLGSGHNVVHHSSTSTYMPNFIEIEETFCGWTDVRTDGRMDGRTNGHLRLALLGRLCRRVNLKMQSDIDVYHCLLDDVK